MALILIVEDEAAVREGLERVVRARGHEARAASSIAEAQRIVAEDGVRLDCILLDLRLGDGDGLDLLASIRQRGLGVPVIVATAFGESDRTIAAMKLGAFELVTKPFELPVLVGVVERALRAREVGKRASVPPAVFPRLVGTSAAMLDVWKAIGRVASSPASVLVVGETGTGKEVVARAIHDNSDRAKEPFVAVNLASLVPTLLESELFGHEKGAFTGATARRAGRFELAGRGTIFLDEIGDLAPSLQTKLLRVLQEGVFERVGGAGEPLENRARVIAATNKPVTPDAEGTTLRADFYYRVAVVEISIPPLRARRSDIPRLVENALARTKVRAVSEEAMRALGSYAWPGNVRELDNVVERAALMCSGEVLDVDDLPPSIRESRIADAPTESRGRFDHMTLKDAMEVVERELIERALERAGDNRSEAARLLGLARPHLYAKLAQHGIGTKKE